MGDISAFVLSIGAVLTGLGLLLGWINYKIDKLKEEDKLNIETIGSIIVLEKAVKKLNAALKIHEYRLDHERDEIYGIQKRLDILEEGHPDSDIDYGEVDDDGNITEVWFEGKRYVPEDKKDEDTVTFYADGRVVAETTRPDPIRYDRMYKKLGGNGATEQLLKRAERLYYIYSTGLISIATYRHMVDELLQEELTHNDT